MRADWRHIRDGHLDKALHDVKKCCEFYELWISGDVAASPAAKSERPTSFSCSGSSARESGNGGQRATASVRQESALSEPAPPQLHDRRSEP